MNFLLTEEWLHRYYGSTKPGQEEEAMGWVLKWRPDLVVEGALAKFGKWKHLTEYLNNDDLVVDRALEYVGTKFASELDAHKTINMLRCPEYGAGLVVALSTKLTSTKSILELGVGGDSAISTAIFLRFLEEAGDGVSLESVDANPLGMTFERYRNVPYWKFTQSDSVSYLLEREKEGRRYDIVFIDTIHSYTHTLKELNAASRITNCMILDDVLFEGNDFDPEPGGVKKALQEWVDSHRVGWSKVMIWPYGQIALVLSWGDK